MIHQIKTQLKKSYEQSARSSRIDHLVKDLVATLQMAYAIEDCTSLYITDGFVEDVQQVIDHYSEDILSYEEPKPENVK